MSLPFEHWRVNHKLASSRESMKAAPNRTLRTRLLLVETHSELSSSRILMLSVWGFRVEQARTRSELFDLRFVAVHLALLSDILGSSELRRSAEDVRRQWPSARVLILGAAHVLDDPLYDEAVDRQISSADLLLAITKMSAYPLSHGVEAWNMNPVSFSDDDAFTQNGKSVPIESDPTKVPGYDSERQVEPQDLPAEERRKWRPLEPSQQLSCV